MNRPCLECGAPSPSTRCAQCRRAQQRERNLRRTHYRGTYPARAAQVRAVAYSNTNTRCWRCGQTMAEIKTTHPHAKWTAGHIHQGKADSPLLPECSPCNFANRNHAQPPNA